MNRIYHFLFYKLYAWNLKLHGRDNMPELHALLGLSILTLMNMFSLPTLFMAIAYSGNLLYPDIPRIFIFAGTILLILIHYLAIYRNGKFKKVIKEFKNRQSEEIRRLNIATWFYIAGTIVALISSWVILYTRSS